MMNRFLRARHWQLFLLTFGIPFFIQLIMMGSMMGSVMSSAATGTDPDPFIMLNYMAFFPIVMILYLTVHFGWYYSVAVGLQDKIPSELQLNLKRFKFFFFFPLTYIVLLIIFMIVGVFGVIQTGGEPDALLLGVGLTVVLPLHFFSMFCMFYIIYFVSKTLKMAELQRNVSFSDYAGEFFLIWLYPIGIWFVQPKINELAHRVSTSTERSQV